MLVMARHIIQKTDKVIYGGFVRDCVLHSVPAADLDVAVSSKGQLGPFLKQLKAAAPLLGLRFLRRIPKGPHVLRGVFVWQDEAPFEVELVNVPHWTKKRPMVDCDVNNLKLTRAGLSHMRPGQGGPLEGIIARATQKQFVLLDFGREERALALGKRGWTHLQSEAYKKHISGFR